MVPKKQHAEACMMIAPMRLGSVGWSSGLLLLLSSESFLPALLACEWMASASCLRPARTDHSPRRARALLAGIQGLEKPTTRRKRERKDNQSRYADERVHTNVGILTQHSIARHSTAQHSDTSTATLTWQEFWCDDKVL